jgi:uncharacterized protein (TIGR02266 family)
VATAPSAPSQRPREGRRHIPWEPLLALAVPAIVFLMALGRAGIWDPYELNVADLARRAAIHVFGAGSLSLPGAENRIPTLGDVGRGELPITSIALAFRLFGLGEVAGRLPMALWGIAGLCALWLWLGRMSGRRAGTYGALLLFTTPLYFVHARTMLGDVVTMASLIFSFGGLSVVLLDPRPRQGRDVAWLLLGLLGLVTGFFSRGGLVGVAVPALSVGLAWVLVAVNDGSERVRLGRGAGAAALIVAGLISAWLGLRGLREATPTSFQPWLGAAVLTTHKPPTFDLVLTRLGHTLFPWSALLPLCIGRLFAPPPGLKGDALASDQRLRLLLLCGAGLCYAAYAWMSTRTGQLPFGGVGLLAAIGALALYDFERGAHPSRALAVASCLLAVLLYEDFSRIPETGLSAFGVANATFPEAFRVEAQRLMAASTLVFAGLLMFSLIDGHEPEAAPHEGGALGRFTAIDEVRGILDQLNAVWQGNLAFVAVMAEAMLVGVGALLFLSDRFRLRVAFREGMSAGVRGALINAWWALPLLVLVALFLVLTARKLFRLGLARAGVPRAWVTLAAGGLSGLVLSFGYFPALAHQLSPKEIFDAYRNLRGAGEPLGLLGVAGRSAAYYSGSDVKPFSDASEAFGWLAEGPERRWLALRSDELAKLNSLYRAGARAGVLPSGIGAPTPDHNLPVLDAHSGQIMLASSRLLPGQREENPLARFVGVEAPRPARPLDVNLNDEVEALGWEVFDAGEREVVRGVVPGKTYVLHLYFRVLATPKTQWKGFIHIDGFGRRFNGDHDLFDGKYPMSLWQPGDIITDRFELKLEPNFTPGNYTLFYGFFSGDRRLQVKTGRHHENRIDGGSFPVLLRPPARGAHQRCTRGEKGATPGKSVVSKPPNDELPDSSNRRSADRFEVTWSVDCETEDTFLYASITNISEMGIFVRTTEPLMIGTKVLLRFAPPSGPQFTLRGQVQWVNPVRALGENLNPGMGVRFLDLSIEVREQIVEAIRTIAYVRNASS